MKRLICAIMLVALCCSFSGCGITAPLEIYGNYVTTSGSGLPSLFGRPYLEISGDGMEPELKEGEIVFFHKVKNPKDLQMGDIIAYWTVINGERVIHVSRIVAIYDGGGYFVFETRDDNKNISNALSVHESEILGVY